MSWRSGRISFEDIPSCRRKRCQIEARVTRRNLAVPHEEVPDEQKVGCCFRKVSVETVLQDERFEEEVGEERGKLASFDAHHVMHPPAVRTRGFMLPTLLHDSFRTHTLARMAFLNRL